MITERTATIHGIECVGVLLSHVRARQMEGKKSVCWACPHSKFHHKTCSEKPKEHFCNGPPAVVWFPREEIVAYRLQGFL